MCADLIGARPCWIRRSSLVEKMYAEACHMVTPWTPGMEVLFVPDKRECVVYWYSIQ
jgi:hypothetical protein